MYVVTFYSFKGGVGRTMALVNAAVHLVQRGRKVLLVDFDLEAPGLDTFELLRTKTRTPGIVEYVTKYVATHEAPDALEFLYEVPGLGRKGGRLWVMPSGSRDEEYERNLQEIDWGELYRDHDGYLMVEDLKEQWRRGIGPDYVFIDSRTGHTDVGGVCTRHLPDSVVILFFPNEQNLRGLTSVVQDIRNEATGPRQKKIALHFVMSNVPDLDDEDSILADRIEAFRKTLRIPELIQIHRYDSLSLLNQSIFTHNRPRSRLAREYGALVDTVISDNPEDRGGALQFLKSSRRNWREIPVQTFEDRLARIGTIHVHDPEILTELARVRQREGKIEDALSLLNAALGEGDATPELLIQRAEMRRSLGDLVGASDDVRVALSQFNVEAPIVSRALRVLSHAAPHALGEVDNWIAVDALAPDEKLGLATQLNRSKAELGAAKRILSRVLSTTSESVQDDLRSQLAMVEIGLGDCESALGLLRPDGDETRTLPIHGEFNYAMAKWGATGQPSTLLFSRVSEMDGERPDAHADANYLQCLALAFWVEGRADDARWYLQRAANRVAGAPSSEFSCWRYLRVRPDEFLADLAEIGQLVDGKILSPLFVRGIQLSFLRDSLTKNAERM